jgi:hypothetical protein
MKAIFVTLLALAAATLLVVGFTYGTIDPCGILRAKIRAEASREGGVGAIASMLPDGIIDGLVAAKYGTLSPGRCIALAFEGPPRPPPAAPRSVPLQASSPARLAEQKGSPEAIKQAWIEAQIAIMECKNKRLSGELKTYKVSADCSNPRFIAAFQRAGYRYMDLIFLMAAKRIELSEKIDTGQMTEAQSQLAFAQLMTVIVDKERQRDRVQ